MMKSLTLNKHDSDLFFARWGFETIEEARSAMKPSGSIGICLNEEGLIEINMEGDPQIYVDSQRQILEEAVEQGIFKLPTF